ncbi:UNVERIFIED_ORG: nucleoside phosphorylase [Rhizobium pisi]
MNAANSRIGRRRFDNAVVIPLEEECQEFINVFELQDDFSTEILFRSSVVSPCEDLSIIIVKQEGMGRTHAGNALSSLLADFDIGLAICLGIAGSLSDDLQLGDVCYSTQVFDVLDNAKASDIEKGKLDLEFSPTHFRTDRALVAALNFIRMKKDLRPLYKDWQTERGGFAKTLVPGDVPGRNGRREVLTEPKAIEGTVACASVTKSAEYNKKLKEIDRKVLAVETESGSVYERATARSIPALTIRGISDHADASKNELEAVSAGAVRQIAASNAAHFLKLQLSNSEFINYVKRSRGSADLTIADQAARPTTTRPLTEAFEEAEKVIRSKLKELCPEYQLQQKGYRLPVPRVRKIESQQHIDDSEDDKPQDIADVLLTNDTLVLTLPATYPDDSIPWVIADHLLANGLGTSQVMPTVVDGDAVTPPKNTLSHLASIKVDDLIADESGIQIVYILDGIPTASKSRMAFLREEIKSKSGAKFIYISRDETQIVELTEFSNEQSADLYRLCSISFHDIALFLQKNFSMSPSEAEVVAYRLSRTFDQFELAAHPSYFAGIPRETLSALLQANRRSELIQLAVDGFLTFVVADDKSDIALSRTTRSRFLRNLVVELKVERRTFSQAQLVEYTETFSKLYDFAIDPLRFIQAFVDKGIIHFDNIGYVKFSLPFVENYLLASELSLKNELADRYYDFKASDFDFQSFDLYCEIGASDDLVRNYLGLMDDLLAQFKLDDDDNHLLLSDKIHSVMLGSQDRLHMLQKKIQQAQAAVKANRGDIKAKQRILDIADYVKEKVAEEGRLEDEQRSSEANEIDQQDLQNLDSLQYALGVWALGVMILGSGAEHLTGDTKQRIATGIVQLGSALIHHWTQTRVAIDYEKAKRELTTPENVLKFFQANGKHTDDIDEAKKFIEMMVDVVEFYMLAQPLRRTMGYLCEQARQKVLAESVAKPSFKEPMEKILHSAWLTDIESGRGKDALHRAIRDLPPAKFLRVNLASHFLTRVHWNHWRKDDRLVLLDMAEEALKPLSLNFKKGELMRAIEKDNKKSEGDE